jgi:hypothetical protein
MECRRESRAWYFETDGAGSCHAVLTTIMEDVEGNGCSHYSRPTRSQHHQSYSRRKSVLHYHVVSKSGSDLRVSMLGLPSLSLFSFFFPRYIATQHNEILRVVSFASLK